jgi:nucleoside-diphosphate-sugar epimerase
MKIVITGGSGFIAKKFIESRNLDDKILNIYRNSISDSELVQNYHWDKNAENLTRVLSDFKPDIIFHLATNYSARDELINFPASIDTSLLLTSILSYYSNENSCPIVLFSTRFSSLKNGNPINFYSLMKKFESKIAKYFLGEQNLCTFLEIGDAYGEDDNRGKLITEVAKSKVSNNKFSIRSPENLVYPVHVEDIVELLNQICVDVVPAPGSYEVIGPDGELRISQLLELAGVKWDIDQSLQGRSIDNYLAASKVSLPNYPNFNPKIHFEKGFNSLVSYLASESQ